MVWDWATVSAGQGRAAVKLAAAEASRKHLASFGFSSDDKPARGEQLFVLA